LVGSFKFPLTGAPKKVQDLFNDLVQPAHFRAL
jgi:hypothetical protein